MSKSNQCSARRSKRRFRGCFERRYIQQADAIDASDHDDLLVSASDDEINSANEPVTPFLELSFLNT